jgi:acyl-coenzyme A synthetase/AMP-(fatty) acid ligase
MPHPDSETLWDLGLSYGDLGSRFIADAHRRLNLSALAPDPSRRAATQSLRGCNVLIYTAEQLDTARALMALDGLARRLIICPGPLPSEWLPSVIERGQVDAVVADQPLDFGRRSAVAPLAVTRPDDLLPAPGGNESVATEWVLFTSGTTGVPKLVVHTLQTLVGPLDRIRLLGAGSVWSTFYDIRRYGGLQILLRALVAGGSMVLSHATETPAEFLERLAAAHVSHVSGTPSHWRCALMSGAARLISPRYVRMSGEVADQAIIDGLRRVYPHAVVAHAFASTEAGLAFDVTDGRAGFPASLVGATGNAASLRVEAGSLRVRSTRIAHHYLGDGIPPVADADGFVDTGDMVELRGDRYHFVGRREGVINIGGFKVHPEEVEAVINQHPNVQMSLVKARRNPVTGSIVVADVVPYMNEATSGTFFTADLDDLKTEILRRCRDALAPYKVPASISIVPSLDIGASGKLARHRA